MNILYANTAEVGNVQCITQGDWTITVKNLGPKQSKWVLYSMTAEKNGRVVLTDNEFTLSARRGGNDKANMRNDINLRMNQITARGEAKSKKDGLPLNLKL